MKLKICGMREPDNIRAVAALEPDYMGLIFYPASPRYAGGLPHEILRTLPASIRRVGVFVDEPEQNLVRIASQYVLDYAQLHGNESTEACSRINRVLPVIKAIAIRTEADFEAARAYEGCCTALLFDTKTELYGGSGQKFDWNILEAYTGKTPFILSGGIGPEDAATIKSLHHPRLIAIDINSRFESEPGIKDTALLKPFVEQIKNQ